MSALNTLSVLFASMIVGYLAFAIASAFRDANALPEMPAPERRPCECFMCTAETLAADTVHFTQWEEEFA